MGRKRVRLKRPQIKWSPEWEGSIKNWSLGFIRKNVWRCDPSLDEEDLLQEAYITYQKICDTYPRVIEPAHFMALFKTASKNQMHDRARVAKLRHLAIDENVTDVLTDRIGEVSNAGYVGALLDEAPEELKLAMAVFAKNPEVLQRANTDESINIALRSALGFDKLRLLLHRNFDFVTPLKNLLSNN